MLTYEESNQRIFLDWLAKELAHKDMSDWYKVDTSTIIAYGMKDKLKYFKLMFFNKKGGSSLSEFYNDSMYNILKSVYFHYVWKPWLFPNVPHGAWPVIFSSTFEIS